VKEIPLGDKMNADVGTGLYCALSEPLHVTTHSSGKVSRRRVTGHSLSTEGDIQLPKEATCRSLPHWIDIRFENGVAAAEYYYLFFSSFASSEIALPPAWTSLPAPSMVLQPASGPNNPARNNIANIGAIIFRIILNLLS